MANYAVDSGLSTFFDLLSKGALNLAQRKEQEQDKTKELVQKLALQDLPFATVKDAPNLSGIGNFTGPNDPSKLVGQDNSNFDMGDLVKSGVNRPLTREEQIAYVSGQQVPGVSVSKPAIPSGVTPTVKIANGETTYDYASPDKAKVSREIAQIKADAAIKRLSGKTDDASKMARVRLTAWKALLQDPTTSEEQIPIIRAKIEAIGEDSDPNSIASPAPSPSTRSIVKPASSGSATKGTPPPVKGAKKGQTLKNKKTGATWTWDGKAWQ